MKPRVFPSRPEKHYRYWQSENRTLSPLYLPAAKEGRFILAEDGDAIYAAEFFESGWNCGLDEAGVRDSFRLILSNWAGD